MNGSPSDGTLYFWLGVCTVTVVIGAVLEFLEDWQIVKEKKAWHERDPWTPIVPKIGVAILIMGLAGEIVFQTWIEHRDTVFKVDAVNRMIALSPRSWSLTPEVERKLVAALKPFAGQKVDFVIRVHGDTTEPSFFANGLIGIVGASGWRDPLGKPFPNFFAPLVVDDAGVTGVMIETGPHASPKMEKAAAALADGLNKELPQLPAYAVTGPVAPWPNRDDGNTLLITVGLKYPLLQSP